MKIYQPLQVRDTETGLWYKEWDVPAGMPIADGLILVAPPKNLLFPKWDSTQGIWVEDKDSIIEKMKADNEALKMKADSMSQLNAKLMLNDIALSKEIEALKIKIGGVK